MNSATYVRKITFPFFFFFIAFRLVFVKVATIDKNEI